MKPFSPDLRKRRSPFLIAAALLFVCEGSYAATLRPETQRAWQQYIRLSELKIESELESEQGFFTIDFLPISDASSARRTIQSGGIFSHSLTTLNEEGREIAIPGGMVHHWVGSVLIRGATLDQVLDWLQDYSHFATHFQEVEESRLLSRNGDAFEVFLKFRRKKIRTVHYNTEHIVQYRHQGLGFVDLVRRPHKASSRTEAVKIAQLESPGTPDEREMPEGQDSGYLWRLNSYWRFKQEPEGTIVELQSISLSRGIPAPIRWLVAPFVRRVPKQTIESTMESIREALALP